METSFPTVHRRPTRAFSLIWAQCQIVLSSPITASGEMAAVGWVRLVIQALHSLADNKTFLTPLVQVLGPRTKPQFLNRALAGAGKEGPIVAEPIKAYPKEAVSRDF